MEAQTTQTTTTKTKRTAKKAVKAKAQKTAKQKARTGSKKSKITGPSVAFNVSVPVNLLPKIDKKENGDQNQVLREEAFTFGICS